MSPNPPTCQTVLKMLKSNAPEKIAKAEQIFKAIGPPASELLLSHASNPHLKLENRLRFLRLAQVIGITYCRDTCLWLQQLIEDKHQDIVVLAKTILFEASPHGVAALFALPIITLRPYGFDKIKKRLRRTRREH